MAGILVNKPEISKYILCTYIAFMIGIMALTVYIAHLTAPTPTSMLIKLLVIGILLAVEAILMLVVRSILRLEYVLSGDKLTIKISKLAGGMKEVRIKSIKSVKRTLIPFGFRVFGASFHGGRYYIPGLGWAFMAIANFKDGVLIEAENGKYIITPSRPDEFIEEIRRLKGGA